VETELENCVINYLESQEGGSLNQQQAADVVEAIMAYRDLSQELIDYPVKVVEDLASAPVAFNASYLPCDIIELRPILAKKSIFKLTPIALFSFEFCRRYLLDYPILLGCDIKSNCGIFSGVVLLKDNPFDISNAIKRIYIRENLLSHGQIDIVEGIFKEYCPESKVYRIGDIPAIRGEKVAQGRRKRRFRVNIETIGVNNIDVFAISEADAVQQALSRRWQSVSKETGQRVKPAKYHLEYWLGSPFWDNIVTEARGFNLNKQIKISDASSAGPPGAGILYYEGEPAAEIDEGITFGPSVARPAFEEGDKVKLRTGGLGFDQSVGRVVERQEDMIRIKWQTGKYKGKETVLDLNNTVLLHSLLEKVQ
jgi:hypothetical protein